MADDDLGRAKGAGDEAHRPKEFDERAFALGRPTMARHVEHDRSPPGARERSRERQHVVRRPAPPVQEHRRWPVAERRRGYAKRPIVQIDAICSHRLT
jgi:hypothetical protein